MAIRRYNPKTAGLRHGSVNLYSEVTRKSPEKRLLAPVKKHAGRNNHGVITQRGRGGGNKRRYRMIDFKRKKDDIPARVMGIEYDPNRTCNIALLEYEDGERRYILAPAGLKDGQTVYSAMKGTETEPGNCMPLRAIPAGLTVHNIEMTPGKGGQMCRAAGSGARLSNKEGKWATLVFPSGEIRQVSLDCRATLGRVGNADQNRVVLGKAGRKRALSRRPKVRGMARNHHEHPMGGGEGRSKSNRAPASATGVLAKGGRTRQRGKASNKRIIRRRTSKRFGQVKVK